MTSETDAEFVERMAQELDYGLASFADRRLFALARRGAEATARIEALEAALKGSIAMLEQLGYTPISKIARAALEDRT